MNVNINHIWKIIILWQIYLGEVLSKTVVFFNLALWVGRILWEGFYIWFLFIGIDKDLCIQHFHTQKKTQINKKTNIAMIINITYLTKNNCYWLQMYKVKIFSTNQRLNKVHIFVIDPHYLANRINISRLHYWHHTALNIHQALHFLYSLR